MDYRVINAVDVWVLQTMQSGADYSVSHNILSKSCLHNSARNFSNGPVFNPRNSICNFWGDGDDDDYDFGGAVSGRRRREEQVAASLSHQS